MRRANTVSRLHGAYLRLSRELAGLFDRRGDLLTTGTVDSHYRRRLLRIEPLEPRQFLSGDGLLSTVAPTWFQDVAADAGHAGTPALTAESANTLGDVQTQAGDAASSFDWIVQFDTAALQGISSVAQVSSLLTGGGVEFDVIRGLGLVGQVLVRSFGSSADAASALSQNVHIAGFEQDIERQLEVSPNDPQTGRLYGMTNIDAPEAWNLSTGSRSVVVGVIDTGIDYTHPDLAANIWTNPGEIAGNGIDDDHNGFVDDVHGYDFVNNDGNPMDDNGHGTHVSGTIAAVGNNGVGVVGVNWAASLMGLKFLDSNGSGYTSDAIRAINYATMMRSQYGVNLRVLNNSWGGGGYSSQMAAAIQANNNAGILFVAAAGNSSSNNDYAPQYPANYDVANVVSVAAVGSNDALASFSSYGASTVDLAAPGVSILSTVPGNRYAWYSGTSMATPHVTGAAALAWAYNPNATVAQVREALLQGVDYVGGLSGKVATSGRLNVYNTLQQLGNNITPTPTTPTPTPTPVAPTLSSLAASPGTASPGAIVTLVADGAADSNGQVASVAFYADSNGNGSFDSGDSLLGTDDTVVGGRAELTINTAGYVPGTYRYFARALDNESLYSNAVTAAVTLVAANNDDYGNSATAAAPIDVGATLSGSIETGRDVDWFKFQAVAGTKYTISTALAGLRDSVLYLYDSNGATLLAMNDDSGGTLASSLTWTPSVNGQYYIRVNAYAASQTGGYRLSLTSVASPVTPPVPTPPPTSPTQPVIGALIASPNVVTAGAPDVLQAQGVYDPDGWAIAVYYYQDANGNGVWDSHDFPIGAATAIAGGTANLNINTSSLSGTYTFFARTLDNNYQFSPAATATLIVYPRTGSSAASAEGGTARQAALVAAQSTLVQMQGLSVPAPTVLDAGLRSAYDQVLANQVFREQALNPPAERGASDDSSRSAESRDWLTARIGSLAAGRRSDLLGESGNAQDVLFARITSWEEPSAADFHGASPATRELLAVVDRFLSRWDD